MAIHPDTLKAVRQLAKAFIEHPSDVEELELYGDLPEQLIDILTDYDQKD
tara:strand:- start:874 stop:1023 length:150 start_codon:yes stop_codon:yes gene_type:complete